MKLFQYRGSQEDIFSACLVLYELPDDYFSVEKDRYSNHLGNQFDLKTTVKFISDYILKYNVPLSQILIVDKWNKRMGYNDLLTRASEIELEDYMSEEIPF